MLNLTLHKPTLNLFHKIFITLILTIVLPTLIVLLVNYNISTRNLENEVSRSNLDTLRQTKEAIDNILQLTDNISFQIIRDRRVKQFLQVQPNLSVLSDVQLINDTINVTQTYLQGISYINKIYIYSFSNQMLLCSDGGIFNRLVDVDIPTIRKLAQNNRNTVWIEPNQCGVLKERSDSVQLVKFIYQNYNRVQGLILIQLKNDAFLKLINDIYIRKSGCIMVVNKDENIVMQRRPNRYEGIFSTSPKIIKNFEGLKKISYQGKNLLISFTTSRYNDWKYVTVLPADELENQASMIRNNIILICLVFTILAVFLSLAMTKGIYNPIALIYQILQGQKPNNSKLQKLLLRKDEFGLINKEINKVINQLSSEKVVLDNMAQENTQLKEQLENNLPKLKNYFLYRLITGDISNKQEMINQANFFMIPLSQNYLVMLVDLDKNCQDGDMVLNEEIKYSIRLNVLNAFQEIMASVGTVMAFYEETGQIIGIVSLEKVQDLPNLMDIIINQSQMFQNLVFNEYHGSVTIATGNIVFTLEDICKSYHDASQALKYKFILGTGKFISSQKMNSASLSKQSPRYNYRKYLKNSIEARNLQQTLLIIDEFKEYLKSNLILKSRYYYTDIINILIQYLHELNYRDSAILAELEKAFLNFDSSFETIDEATIWIGEIIGKVFNSLTGDEYQNLHKLVEQMLIIIDENYQKDLSLSEVAEKLSVSTSYLSRLFKEKLHKNFKEYLTEYKIKKAKELLSDIGLSIHEVALKVGYNNPMQFTRMFKKYERITPAEYRERIK